MKKFGVFCCLILLQASLCAQSNHYWSSKLTTESSLLSSAVVAGGGAESAIYYNPATIAKLENSKFSTNTNLFSFSSLIAENALGDGLDVNFSQVDILPRFVSYMFYPKNSDWTIEIASFSRVNSDLEKTISEKKSIDILEGYPGDDNYFASINIRDQYSDQYFGMGTSWRLSKSISIGASTFVSYKNLRNRFSTNLLAYPDNSDTLAVSPFKAEYSNFQDVDIDNFRMLFRMGVLIERASWSFGFNIAPPSFKIYENSEMLKKLEASNIFLPDGTRFDDLIFLENPSELKSEIKDPFSVSAGVAFTPNSRSNLYASVEYFHKIDPYSIIELENTESYTEAELNFLTSAYGANTVINFALGYTYQLSERTLILSGIRTDFNYLLDYDYGALSDQSTLQFFDMDIYHITAGSRFAIGNSDITLGVEYSFGRRNGLRQLVNITQPVEFDDSIEIPLQGKRTNTMNYNYNSINLFFGFTFGKKSSSAEKIEE